MNDLIETGTAQRFSYCTLCSVDDGVDQPGVGGEMLLIHTPGFDNFLYHSNLMYFTNCVLVTPAYHKKVMASKVVCKVPWRERIELSSCTLVSAKPDSDAQPHVWDIREGCVLCDTGDGDHIYHTPTPPEEPEAGTEDKEA